jgi:hypothetical protein
MYIAVAMRGVDDGIFTHRARFGKKSYKSRGWYIKIYENEIISGPVVFLRLAFTHKSGI